MAVKVKLGGGRQFDHEGIPVRRGGSHRPLWMRALLGLMVLALGCLVLGAMVFGYFYNYYQKVVDDRLNNGPLFSATAQIYAAPREVRPGQELTSSRQSRRTCIKPAITRIPTLAPFE